MSDRESLQAVLAQAEAAKAAFEKLLPHMKNPEVKAWREASIKQLDECIEGCKMALEMGDAAWVKPGQT